MSYVKNTSLFVPHVFPNFSQNYVATAFADIGEVERVDFVAKQDRDGKPYNAAYIHFKKWGDDRFACETISEIFDNGSTKFYHDNSEYFWIVLPNTAKKHVSGDRKPRIDLGEAKSISVNSPLKVTKPAVCPGAPMKPSYAQALEKQTSVKLQSAFDSEEWDSEASEEAAQMAEIEAELQAEDQNLVNIDWRYIQAIEQENLWLHGEIAQLRMALINLDQMYQAEKAKVRAFSNVEPSVDV